MFIKIVTNLLFCLIFVRGDYEESCIKEAMAHGISSINLPSYDPLQVGDFNISSNILGYDFNITFYDVIWYNIPWWNLTKFEKIFENDIHADYTFNLNWEYFNITGDYEFTVNSSNYYYQAAGPFQIDMEIVDWNGNYSFRKPTDYNSGNFTILRIIWETNHIKANFTGVDIEGANDEISNILEDYILLQNVQNSVGKYYQKELNNNWLNDTERLDGLTLWCKDNVKNNTILDQSINLIKK